MNLPSYFQQIKSMPDDPEGSSAFMTGADTFEAFAIQHPIPIEHAMPTNDDWTIINGIHNTVTESQALIEVKSGKTKCGNQYVYSIVKTKMEPHGVQYTLVLHLLHDNKGTAEQFKAFFSEAGTTGVRDTVIHSALVNEGIIESEDPRWMRDPYDENIKDRFLMNLSELEQFDQNFPTHPLSVARRTIHGIVENN